MNRFPRCTKMLATIGASALLTIGIQLASAQNSRVALPVTPESGSAQVAKAIRSGAVHIPTAVDADEVQGLSLTCSPLPCVLPNVRASANKNIANEVPIIANPRNPSQLLTGANDYNCTSSFQGFYGSSDGGSTWTHSCLPTLAGGSGLGDPMVAYDRFNNAFAGGIGVGSPGQVLVVSRSRDNGATWTAPVVATTQTFSGGSVDKGWMEIDTNPTSPRVNCMYVSATQFDSSGFNSQISVAHSCNHGQTWKTVAVDAEQFYPGAVDQFSDLAVAKDGTVYVSWMRCPATGPTGDCGGTTVKMLVAKSTDGGNTWSAEVTAATPNLAPDSCGAFYGCLPNTFERVSDIPAIAVDTSASPRAGRLYMIYYTYASNRMQVFVTRSADGGATWSAGVSVADSTTNDQFFPWVNTSLRGTVGASWLDRRNDAANVKYDTYASFSTNAGASFGTNQKISEVLSDPFKDGFGSGFMGDYTGNTWDGATLFVSFPDSRTGSFMQDEVGGYVRTTP